MTYKQREHIKNIVYIIDSKIEELKEKYKNTAQYRSTKKYRIADSEYLRLLLERRNTLTIILNYDFTGDVKELEVLKQ